MTTRTTRTNMTLKHPFELKGVDGMLPAGEYRVLTR
jgi:hypothetical protein